MSQSDDDTVKRSGSQPETEMPTPCSSSVEVDLAGLSDQGKVRLSNDDHFLIIRYERLLQTLVTNLPEGCVPQKFDEVGYGMIVADGLGGEFASRMAINMLVSLVLNTPDWIMRLGEREVQVVMKRMADRFQKINASLIEQAALNPALLGMHSTMTVAATLGADMLIAHIGDSRAYILRQGTLHRLTSDHTLAQSIIDGGVISSRSNASVRKFRNVLTQSLGAKGRQFKPEVQRTYITDGDRVLLCTDGLTDLVDDATIADVLQSANSAQESCQSLIDLALKLGGTDNVTVVVARYRFPM